MKREDWYKIMAVGIVLIFIFEAIALGVLQNPGSTPSGTGGTSQISFTGNVVTNVTVTRYEPYIIVEGSGSAFEAVKQQLLDSKVATYAIPSGAKLIVNLKSSKEVVAAAAAFESANATVLASATIATPSTIRVEGSDISTQVDGTSFSMQIRPLFEEGSTVPASFAVGVENGVVTGIGNFALLPSVVRGAMVEAEVVGISEDITVEVPWESRQAAKPLAQSEGFAYREKSFITVQQNATNEKLAAAAAAGKEYITSVQTGIVSVRNDFSDRQRAETDLAASGLVASFPASTATRANLTDSALAGQLVQKLAEQNITANQVAARTVKVKLPDSIEEGGRSYSGKGFELEFAEPGEIAVGSRVRLLIDFEATGNRLYRMLSVRLLGNATISS